MEVLVAMNVTTGVKAKAAAAGTNTPSVTNFPASTSGIYNVYGNATLNADDTNSVWK